MYININDYVMMDFHRPTEWQLSEYVLRQYFMK